MASVSLHGRANLVEEVLRIAAPSHRFRVLHDPFENSVDVRFKVTAEDLTYHPERAIALARTAVRACKGRPGRLKWRPARRTGR